MADPKTVAKQAAKEDALPTGGAKLPGTEPVRKRNTLTEAERRENAAKQLDARLNGLTYRTEFVCKQLADMGVSSLAGQLQRYTDIPFHVRKAALEEVQARVTKCLAALEASTATQAVSAAAAINLRGLMGRPGSP